MRPKRQKTPRRGLRVVGPCFYLWDPDAREALRLAEELGPRRARPSRRDRRTVPPRMAEPVA